MRTTLELDYETASEIDLKARGLDVYSSDPSTKALMCAYAFDGGSVKLWTVDDGPFPKELSQALADPDVEKWAFNAQFERIVTKRVQKIATPYQGWRCAMVLGHMQAFTGSLDMMVRQAKLPDDLNKLKEGKRLIRKFCGPQRVTKNNPLRWRNSWTDPEDWQLFCDYCVQDVIAERAFKKRVLDHLIIPPEEWEIYEYDQEINDRGLPIDMDFVENAIQMAARRKAELTDELRELTGLSNPNSPVQLTAWLRDRGYPFSDLGAKTVLKVITEEQERAKAGNPTLPEEVMEALEKRQAVARTSTSKFVKLKQTVVGGRFRFGFQYGGASRTLRWAGRGFNPQNLMRTPKFMEPDKSMREAGVEPDFTLDMITNFIREGDYEMVRLSAKEPLEAIAGAGRSAIRAADDEEIISCDLSSIESCVLAWVSNCERLLNVFEKGLDPYIDFGTFLYEKKYEEVTKRERQDSKPAVLGCGYRLGGGELKEGKRTGLWGYAEGMGVQLTRAASHKAVRKFRDAYPEIPKLWYALEEAAIRAVRNPHKPTVPMIKMPDGSMFRVPVMFEMRKPFLTIILPVTWPSGKQRRLWYLFPKIQKVQITGADGETFEKEALTYMGKLQNGQGWVRLNTHGGKITENIVQAIARDALAVGLVRAMRAGWPLIGHVHDELIALVKKGSNMFTGAALRELMIKAVKGLKGLPLNASPSTYQFYRKD